LLNRCDCLVRYCHHCRWSARIIIGRLRLTTFAFQ